MPQAVETEHPYIVRIDGVCGGGPVIDGLRVAVRQVVVLHQRGEFESLFFRLYRDQPC